MLSINEKMGNSPKITNYKNYKNMENLDLKIILSEI